MIAWEEMTWWQVLWASMNEPRFLAIDGAAGGWWQLW